MDNISTITYNSLTNYFDYLEKVGYMKDSNIEQLLLLNFIQDFVSEFLEDLYEEDYMLLTRIVNCLYSNSCLISWNKCDFRLMPAETV